MRNRLGHIWQERAPAAPPWDWDAQPAGRLGWLYALMFLPLCGVALRVADLQFRLQPAFTAVFARAETRLEDMPTRDGRILAADGAVLADDVVGYDLLMHYRWLESPADPRWLRRKAWERLSRVERRQSAVVAGEETLIVARREQLWRDLAWLTGRPEAELRQPAREVQERVERIWRDVVDRKEAAAASAETAAPIAAPSANWWEAVWRRVQDELTQPPQRRSGELPVVREQEEFHVLLRDIPKSVADEIEARPERYPGVRVAIRFRRVYPQQTLAAHLLGARTPLQPDELAEWRARDADYRAGDLVGRSGLERQYHDLLRGRRGRKALVFDRHGELLRTEIVQPPQFGRDVVLTLDPQLQRSAEQLLDAALAQPLAEQPAEDESPESARQRSAPPQGGCLVALDVHTGAVLAAAAAPRYDANLLVAPDPAQWQRISADPRKPFYPRLTQMALPPGSVFKAATAIALLESGALPPDEHIACRGYLDHPGQHRCLTFRHFGVGHGDVDLADALCRSCNVYFFTGARRAGPETLVSWSRRLGIGAPTGIDLPGETGGYLPSPDAARVSRGRRWYPGDTLGLAIGQSSLTVTPLQMARLMALIANDGALVTPHLVAEGGPTLVEAVSAGETVRPVFAHPEPVRIAELDPAALAAIRAGLTKVVQDPHGTGYKTVRLKEVAIAGKTGTAEVGGGRPDHAWFAGYVPADRPRVAFAVVLEHGGSGGKVAGPVAREFVRKLLDLGLIERTAAVAGP